jgi:hypothetical protein
VTTKDEKFDAKVDRSGGAFACWPWTGARSDGYGRFFFRVNGKLHSIQAHRYAFERATGEKLGDRFGCHRCDNPPCCNPAHIFAGTTADNTRDCMAKGRMAAAIATRGQGRPRKYRAPKVNTRPRPGEGIVAFLARTGQDPRS